VQRLPAGNETVGAWGVAPKRLTRLQNNNKRQEAGTAMARKWLKERDKKYF
jgi:hypothetical protein